MLDGESFVTYIDTDVIYPQIKRNPSSIYSFLLVAGYLKVIRMDIAYNGDYMCEVALPNKEIRYVYSKEILQKLENMILPATVISVQEAMYIGDSEMLQQRIQTLLTQTVSAFDTAGENFYHGFVLGLCALVNDSYVTSNRESGDGRYDIQLMPKNKHLPGILIELKAEKDCDEKALKKLSQKALQQIESKRYDSELISKGIHHIYKYGVAFSGKHVCVSGK